MKRSKIKHKENHVSPNKIGQGDFYGTGVKQKVGTEIRGYLNTGPTKAKNYGKPPKSLA